jgi:prepilin-type processing-associated H-X9-DG protein
MNRTAAAFTLVELLFVILMILVLLGLLMPGLNAVIETAKMTQCQWNLSMIYKAHILWIADRDRAQSNTGGGWAKPISDYLEHQTVTMKCPSCPRLAVGVTAPEDDVAKLGGAPPPPLEESVYISLADVTIGVISPAGQVLYEIPLSPSPYWSWYQTRPLPDGRTQIEANIDNNFGKDKNTGLYTDTDFVFIAEYNNGRLVKVTIGDCDGNGDLNYTDFRVNHEPLWGGQKFFKRFGEGHVNETIDLVKESKAAGKAPETPTEPWTVLSSSPGFLGLTNYGMSRGSHVDAAGKEVAIPDPRMFFILDYPNPVADYTHLGTDDAWSQIFVLDPAHWTPPPGYENYTCEEIQALRHFGKTNVLFCDGHIELIGPDPISNYAASQGSFLRPDSRNWRSGR